MNSFLDHGNDRRDSLARAGTFNAAVRFATNTSSSYEYKVGAGRSFGDVRTKPLISKELRSVLQASAFLCNQSERWKVISQCKFGEQNVPRSSSSSAATELSNNVKH